MQALFRAAAAAGLSLAAAAPALADNPQSFVTSQHKFLLTTVAEGLEHPWGLDWLPDGRIVVTERAGRIRIVETDGTLGAPLGNVPEIVTEFRDGLLDISVSPNFAEDNTLYFAYSQKNGDLRWMELASARLAGDELKDVTVIFTSGVKTENLEGFGSRIRFDANGNMLVSVGDHAELGKVQDTSNTLGTIVRLRPDGTPVADNPGGALHPAIYAYGFKNPHGLALAEDGTLWAIDHGGVGGDELSRVEMGANYGWPTRTFSGGDAPGAGQASAGPFADPAFTWGSWPIVAPSGLEIYTGDEFPNWRGDLFTGSLSQSTLIRILLDDEGDVIGTETVLNFEIGRVRDVRQGPDGRLYLLNDELEGGIFRIDPAE